jgi:pyruvate dehydrogenase (quinone)
MARKVADVLWEMLVNAGVRRCYGIVGDALNPVIDGAAPKWQGRFCTCSE